MSRLCTRCQQTVPDGDLLCACQVVTDPSADVIARVRALAADFESRGDFATASDLLALCTAYAQVTAERDRWAVWHIKGVPGAPDAWTTDISHASGSGPRATLIRSPEQFASVVASIVRADLAAQVEGMDTLTIGSYGIMAENVRIVGKTQFVSRDEVLTLLRGPHAD